jgi:hypothetical protein
MWRKLLCDFLQKIGFCRQQSVLVVATNPPFRITQYPFSDARDLNGDRAPTWTIAGPNTAVGVLNNVAVHARKIYAAIDSAVVSFPLRQGGDLTPTFILAGQISLPVVRTDKHGNFVVANVGETDALVQIFPAVTASISAAPDRVIVGSNTGFGMLFDIGVDLAGRIYVVNAPNPSLSFETRNILVFAAGANGNVAPAAIINPNTEFGALGVGPDGTVYVVAPGDKILVFSPGASGSVAPTAIIQGAHTKLAGPSSIAIGSDGNIYVTNGGASQPSVNIYPQGANGDTAPLAVLAGTATQLVSPGPIAVS